MQIGILVLLGRRQRVFHPASGFGRQRNDCRKRRSVTTAAASPLIAAASPAATVPVVSVAVCFPCSCKYKDDR
jgi:hypothetical protein